MSEGDLVRPAEDCIRSLAALRTYAVGSRSDDTSHDTQPILNTVDHSCVDFGRSLTEWKASLAGIHQTSDRNRREVIEDSFRKLAAHIQNARGALSTRLKLHYRKFNTVPFLSKRRAERAIEEALGRIRDAIKGLISQSRLATSQEPRRTTVDRTLNHETAWYKVFQQRLREKSPIEKQLVQQGAFDFLWNALPGPPPLLESKMIASKTSPGDGHVYTKEQIQRAKDILRDYHNAWSEDYLRSPHEGHQKVGPLTNKAEICLILNVLDRRDLLESFCRPEHEFISFPLDQPSLERIFGSLQDKTYVAERFVTEQYRVINRNWDDGQYEELPRAEPLPFLIVHDYGSGSFGRVKSVRDVRTRRKYARKEQGESESRRFHKEKDALEKLGHRHIIKYVKGFKRGKFYYLLLEPAAEGNLEDLLEDYTEEETKRLNGETRSKAQELKSAIMRLFGCLSFALCYIHRTTIHKDIKPNNILYETKTHPKKPTNVLFADFGEAHEIPKSGLSGTNNPRVYSLKWAAPDDSSVHLTTTRSTSLPATDETPATTVNSKSTGSALGTTKPVHGRKDDVYSLGCVFLEILSTLLRFPIPDYDEQGFEFRKKREKLRNWVEDHKKHPNCSKPLEFLFDLAILMTEPLLSDRPDIAQVTTMLIQSKHTKDFFCAACKEEATAQQESGELENSLRRVSSASRSTTESFSAISEEGDNLAKEPTRTSRHGRYLEPPPSASAKRFHSPDSSE